MPLDLILGYEVRSYTFNGALKLFFDWDDTFFDPALPFVILYQSYCDYMPLSLIKG
jgi:hypothetical protein